MHRKYRGRDEIHQWALYGYPEEVWWKMTDDRLSWMGEDQRIRSEFDNDHTNDAAGWLQSVQVEDVINILQRSHLREIPEPGALADSRLQ